MDTATREWLDRAYQQLLRQVRALVEADCLLRAAELRAIAERVRK